MGSMELILELHKKLKIQAQNNLEIQPPPPPPPNLNTYTAGAKLMFTQNTGWEGEGAPPPILYNTSDHWKGWALKLMYIKLPMYLFLGYTAWWNKFLGIDY